MRVEGTRRRRWPRSKSDSSKQVCEANSLIIFFTWIRIEGSRFWGSGTRGVRLGSEIAGLGSTDLGIRIQHLGARVSGPGCCNVLGPWAIV